MESKDLRIGNKIYGMYDLDKEKNEVVEVVCIDVVGITEFGYNIIVDGKHEQYQEFNGIPLTEKYIKKAGFKQKINKLFDLKIFRKGIYFISISEKGNMFGFKKSADEQYTPIKKLKYVHKLQNLYFELEDSELVFSEV